MYNVSTQFKKAIYGDSPDERAMLVFNNDLYFDNGDISADDGIKYTDNFNLDEDFTLGQTLSNQLNVSLVNPGAILSGYQFGSFRALLGVYVGDFAYASSSGAEVFCTVDGILVGGKSDSSPYLLSSISIDIQPSQAVYALFAYNDTLYAIHADGSATKYMYVSGSLLLDGTYAANSFMQNKWAEWADTGKCVSIDGNYIYEFGAQQSGIIAFWQDVAANIWSDMSGIKWGDYASITARVYECAPLGTFYAERPATTNGATVDIVAYDKMTSLEVLADDFVSSITWPATLQTLYDQFCAYYGLSANNALPVNGAHSYASAPDVLTGLKARELLGYIAEAAGAVARFDRDELLEMAWFDTTDATWNVPWQYTQTVIEYNIQPVTGVFIYYKDGTFVKDGVADNAYIINGNPLFEDKSGGATSASNLFAQLGTIPIYAPSNATIPGNWAIQSGDIIEVGETMMPVFVQTMTWRGGAMTIAETTGNEYRQITM